MKSPIRANCPILTSLAACFLAATALTAPAPAQTRFDRFYDSSSGSPERASSLEQTSDRGYIMLGTRRAGTFNVIYAIKTNQHGVVQWSKSYSNPLGTPSDMYGSCVRQTRDGGYIFAGSTTNYGPNQLLLIKTDPLGNITWQRAFDATVDTDPLRGPVVRERIGPQGGYVVIANITNPVPPPGPAAAGLLLRTDAAGNYLSEHFYMDGRFQAAGTTIFRDVRQDADGTYIIVGTTFRTATPGLREALVFKTLPDSPLMFAARAYGPPSDANDGESLELTSGGGYAFVGHRTLPTNLTLFKTNPALAPIFNRLFIGLDTAYSLRENAWYDLVSTGISPFAGFNAPTLMKNNLTGLFQWANQYPYTLPGEKDAAQGVPTSDGGYALTGWTNFGPNPFNFSLVKADNNGRDCELIPLQPQQPPWQPVITPIDLIPIQLDIFTPTQLIAIPDQPRTDFSCFFPGCTTPPWNMVFWAPFDFTSPFVDLAGGGAGIPIGAPASGAGYVGTSLCYNTGLTTYVDFPNSLSKNFNLGDFSMDAWVRRPNNNGQPLNDGVRVVLDKRSTYANGAIRGYSMFLNNGSLGVQVATGPAINYGSGLPGTVPADGQWHCVAATVRRSGLGPEVLFYLDGVQAGPSVPVNPANLGVTVNNPSRLRIGARITGGPVLPSVFHDCIDEVELFNRALAPAEIASIFQAQAAGKCRESCYTPIVQMCPTNTTVTVLAYVCNYTTTTQTYTYTLQGLSVGPGCNIAGPNFTPLAYAPVTVLPGQCAAIPVTIPRPLGLANGLAGCWQMCFQSTSGASFCCTSRVVGNNLLCISDPTGGWNYSGLVGVPVPMHFRADNLTTQDLRIPIRFAVMDPEAAELPGGTPDPTPQAISLNGLPPGVPWEVPPGFMIPAGGSVPLDLMAEMIRGSEDSLHRIYTIILEADLDGDGAFEPLASIALHNDTPPPCPADFNLDGRANSQDFFDFIQAFFALDPSADVNADGVINSQDFFDFLQLFFAGC